MNGFCGVRNAIAFGSEMLQLLMEPTGPPYYGSSLGLKQAHNFAFAGLPATTPCSLGACERDAVWAIEA